MDSVSSPLYDKEKNEQWIKDNAANTPLAVIHNVNFKIKDVRYDLTHNYNEMIKNKKLTKDELIEMIDKYNNVVKQMFIKLVVIKQ